MSEKGDLPQDTDSLPPNYATSEVYTDSPPPAYRKTSTVRLQVTRVICFTILAAGFLAGAFILTHTWITSSTKCDCKCDKLAPNSSFPEYLGAHSLPNVESLVASAVEDEANLNSLQESQEDKESRQMDIPLPLDDSPMMDDTIKIIEEAVEQEEEEEENLQSLVKDVQDNAKFPLDLILGNPQLAGKETKCKVQKKLQNLGSGIISKSIIVTCDDEDDQEQARNNPLVGLMSSRPAGAPPMSLIAPILKMMAARATARLQRQLQPKPSFRNFQQPFLQPVGMSFNGPFRPKPFSGPMHFDGPFPFPQPAAMNHHHRHHEMDSDHMMRTPFEGEGFPMHGNSIMQPNIIPMPFIPHNAERPFQSIEEQQSDNQESFPGDFVPFDGERDAPFREDFIDNNMHAQGPIVRIVPANNMQAQESNEAQNSPIKIVHGFPPQMPEALRQIVSHIMSRPNSKVMSDGQSPIIKIKAIPSNEQQSGDQPRSKLLLPFPIRALKVQGRGARKLENNGEFPMLREAMSHGMKPHVVPEAAGRALDSPVALPSLSELPPLRFFPGRLLRIPVPIQGRAITHMEMNQNPNMFFNNNVEQQQQQHNNFESDDNTDSDGDDGPDFGPPRRHTVLRHPPMNDNIPEESHLPPFMGNFPPPPPPPSFAREGRVGIIREVNPEAELVNTAESHRMIMVN